MIQTVIIHLMSSSYDNVWAGGANEQGMEKWRDPSFELEEGSPSDPEEKIPR